MDENPYKPPLPSAEVAHNPDPLEVELDEPVVETARFGTNPKAPGFRKYSQMHMVIFLAFGTIGALYGASIVRPNTLAGGCIVLASFALVTLVIVIRRSMTFCSNCGASTNHASGDEGNWCAGCHSLLKTPKLLQDDVHQFNSAPWLETSDQYLRVLGVILRYTFDGEVQRLEIQDNGDQLRIGVFRDNEAQQPVYQLDPPPYFVLRPIVDLLKAMFRLRADASSGSGTALFDFGNGTQEAHLKYQEYNVQLVLREHAVHAA